MRRGNIRTIAAAGETLQWLVLSGNHPLRIRLWGELQEPLNDPTVRDLGVLTRRRAFTAPQIPACWRRLVFHPSSR